MKTISLVTLLSVAAAAVIDLTDDSFAQLKTPALVEFYASWCGHCKTLAPVYEELGELFGERVSIARIDADIHQAAGKKYGIKGFPTLKWLLADGGVEEYSGGRSLEALSDFVTQKTSVRPRRQPKEPSKVVLLKDASFEDVVLDGGKDVMVAFKAPWCGHCKTLQPTWEKLAADYADDADVVIAEMDATDEGSKRMAERYGVTSFPQLKFFGKAAKGEPEDYQGPRGEGDLLHFINGHTGLHRVAGGGLSELAGRIPELDAVAQKLASGRHSMEEALAEAAKVSGEVMSSTKEYYLKIFRRLQTGGSYARDELRRLESILGKGGLARQKMDDFTVRRNILGVFQARDEL